MVTDQNSSLPPRVCQLAGAALTVRKSTWAGAHRRRGLLAEAGIVIPEQLGKAGESAGESAGVDDVLLGPVLPKLARSAR